MDKWEVTRYLIDAKKAVDSVCFIAQNGEKLRNIDIRKEIESHKSDFYINICTVLDEFTGGKKGKREVCNSDMVINAVYYERDKHYAHKDSDYRPKEYNSLTEIYEDMKSQLIHVRDICKSVLPEVVTLDFVPHDRQLFRHLHGVTPEKEEDIKKAKHPEYGKPVPEGVETKSFKILQDTEDARFLTPEDCKKYAVVFECGICSNESIQNFQDAAIKANVLSGENIWCSIDREQESQINEIRKLGYLDEFDIPHVPNLSDPIARNLFLRDMQRGLFYDKT